MKVAILGGSFDPVHCGHIAMAKTALQALDCNQVWFMPTQDTPLKDHSLTPAHHRVAMIERILNQDRRFRVCRLEVEREGKSYTIDTVRQLTRQYPENTFYWLIGNDQIAQFADWKDADQLVKLCHFVGFDRDGKMADSPYDIQRIHMPMVPVSSSEIRIGNKLNYLPQAVREYIYEHRLYIKEFVHTRVNEHRYLHSVSVADLCQHLAIANGQDPQKAYLIGLFHDIAKSMSKEAMEQWMDILCPENKKYAVPVWHGFVGSEIVDRIFYLRDPQIKNAIYHHVLGTSTDPYAEIVFCADKTDPLRNYDSSELIALCEKDIHQGFIKIKEENEKYLRKG